MKGTRRSAAIVAIRSAVSSACFSFSIAHGPPMSASGWPPPRTTLPIRIIVTGAASSPSTEGGLPEVRGGSVVTGAASSPSTEGGLPEVRGGSVVTGAASSPSTEGGLLEVRPPLQRDRKSTLLNSSHTVISYAVFCLKKKKEECDSSRS